MAEAVARSDATGEPFSLDYRVVAADGHPVIGSVPFTVTSAAASAARKQGANGSASQQDGFTTSVSADDSAGTTTVAGGRWDFMTTALGIGTVAVLLLLALARRGAGLRAEQS